MKRIITYFLLLLIALPLSVKANECVKEYESNNQNGQYFKELALWKELSALTKDNFYESAKKVNESTLNFPLSAKFYKNYLHEYKCLSGTPLGECRPYQYKEFILALVANLHDGKFCIAGEKPMSLDDIRDRLFIIQDDNHHVVVNAMRAYVHHPDRDLPCDTRSWLQEHPAGLNPEKIKSFVDKIDQAAKHKDDFIVFKSHGESIPIQKSLLPEGSATLHSVTADKNERAFPIPDQYDLATVSDVLEKVKHPKTSEFYEGDHILDTFRNLQTQFYINLNTLTGLAFANDLGVLKDFYTALKSCNGLKHPYVPRTDAFNDLLKNKSMDNAACEELLKSSLSKYPLISSRIELMITSKFTDCIRNIFNFLNELHPDFDPVLSDPRGGMREKHFAFSAYLDKQDELRPELLKLLREIKLISFLDVGKALMSPYTTADAKSFNSILHHYSALTDMKISASLTFDKAFDQAFEQALLRILARKNSKDEKTTEDKSSHLGEPQGLDE